MKVTSSEQMHQIDIKAITKYGIPEIVLMENAGNEISQEVVKQVGTTCKVCIIAGYGNNGGDAFVAARHLLNNGAKCKVFLLGNKSEDDFSPSAKINYNILKAMEAEIYHIVSERDWNRFQFALTFSDIIIDGLMGTGIKGTLSEISVKCIEQINNSKLPIIAIDIPSGLNSNTGELSPIAVKATTTITFGLPKVGMYMVETKDHVGNLIIKNIGIPNEILESDDIKINAIDFSFSKLHLKKRPNNVHKGSCGKVLVIAGSTGYTGAAKLASEAALRIGAGLVTLGVAKSIYPIIATNSREVIVKPLPELESGILGTTSENKIIEYAENADVVLIGPGLGKAEETLTLIQNIVSKINKTIILDADAIFALRNKKDLLINRKYPTILTPHLGELSSFTNKSIKELRNDLLTIGEKLAVETNSTIVIKSEQTITFNKNGEIFINTSGNSGMATAGTGDVLAGTLAGLIAENLCSEYPVPIGVYIHGLAGDFSSSKGLAGLIATDVLENLQVARNHIEK